MLVASVVEMTRGMNERPKFEKQEFDGENDAGNRRIERRGHAGTRAAGQQHLALCRRRREQLPYQRAKRAAGLDYGPFRPKRSAGADGDRRGKRLEDGDFGFDAAARFQHRLHGLGDAVSLDFIRTVFGHDADGEPAAAAARDTKPSRYPGVAGCKAMALACWLRSAKSISPFHMQTGRFT
jgi:hypothetical protein